MLELVTERDAERLLLNRGAAAVLGVAAILSFSAIPLLLTIPNLASLKGAELQVLSGVGAFSALVCALYVFGMLLYQVKLDVPSRRGHFIWFLGLMVGFPVTTTLYYTLIYIPALRRRLRELKMAKG